MMPSKMFRSQFLLVVQWKHLQFDSQHRFEIWHVVFCVAINWPSTFADGPEAITVDAPDWPLHKNKNYPHPSVLVCCCEEQVRKNWFVAQANVNIWLLACLCRSDRPVAWDKTRATKSRAFPLLYAIDPWCHIMNRTESPPPLPLHEPQHNKVTAVDQNGSNRQSGRGGKRGGGCFALVWIGC